MMRSRRLLLLLIPLALGIASAAGTGRAQTSGNARFAFADTTLLRDTLGLNFDRLFELSDSLGMRPDTLRALSVRYGFLPWRLVEMADSMRVPVDSVGVMLLRERFNPLSATSERVNEVNYTSGYSVVKNQSSWTNNGSFRIVRGSLFLHNTTRADVSRFSTSRGTTEKRNTNATTELGWRLHPTTSLGGRVVLNGIVSDDASTGDVRNENNEYQVSVRTRHRPSARVNAELNGYTGLSTEENASLDKTGGSGELNGQLTWLVGDWMTTDLSAQFTGKQANALLRKTGLRQDTRDVWQTYRGNVAMFPQSHVNISSDFNYRDFRNMEPDVNNVLQQVRTAEADANLAVRARLDNDRSVNLTQTVRRSDRASLSSAGQSKGSGASTAADARYRLFAMSLEARFNLDFSTNELPTVTDSGGYREETESRRLEGVLSRQLTDRITARATANINLARFRYGVIGQYAGLPIERDQTQQKYRIEGVWSASRDLNTGVALDVSRSELVNLPAASVSANNLLRTYRAEWNWTYRLFSMLTATQRNSISSSYTAYRYNQASDRVALDYNTVTTLNAVLTPRLTVDLTHNSQEQPSGGWVYFEEEDQNFFQPADENRNYQLGARVSYTPVSGLTLVVEPRYRASNRYGTDALGNQVAQRGDRYLSVTGSVNVNLNVGRHGRLAGVIGPRFESSGSRQYSSGVPLPSTVNESQDWTGSLQFSWTL
jgi:hypothetical protein